MDSGSASNNINKIQVKVIPNKSYKQSIDIPRQQRRLVGKCGSSFCSNPKCAKTRHDSFFNASGKQMDKPRNTNKPNHVMELFANTTCTPNQPNKILLDISSLVENLISSEKNNTLDEYTSTVKLNKKLKPKNLKMDTRVCVNIQSCLPTTKSAAQVVYISSDEDKSLISIPDNQNLETKTFTYNYEEIMSCFCSNACIGTDNQIGDVDCDILDYVEADEDKDICDPRFCPKPRKSCLSTRNELECRIDTQKQAVKFNSAIIDCSCDNDLSYKCHDIGCSCGTSMEDYAGVAKEPNRNCADINQVIGLTCSVYPLQTNSCSRCIQRFQNVLEDDPIITIKNQSAAFERGNFKNARKRIQYESDDADENYKYISDDMDIEAIDSLYDAKTKRLKLISQNILPIEDYRSATKLLTMHHSAKNQYSSDDEEEKYKLNYDDFDVRMDSVQDDKTKYPKVTNLKNKSLDMKVIMPKHQNAKESKGLADRPIQRFRSISENEVDPLSKQKKLNSSTQAVGTISIDSKKKDFILDDKISAASIKNDTNIKSNIENNNITPPKSCSSLPKSAENDSANTVSTETNSKEHTDSETQTFATETKAPQEDVNLNTNTTAQTDVNLDTDKTEVSENLKETTDDNSNISAYSTTNNLSNLNANSLFSKKDFQFIGSGSKRMIDEIVVLPNLHTSSLSLLKSAQNYNAEKQLQTEAEVPLRSTANVKNNLIQVLVNQTCNKTQIVVQSITDCANTACKAKFKRDPMLVAKNRSKSAPIINQNSQADVRDERNISNSAPIKTVQQREDNLAVSPKSVAKKNLSTVEPSMNQKFHDASQLNFNISENINQKKNEKNSETLPSYKKNGKLREAPLDHKDVTTNISQQEAQQKASILLSNICNRRALESSDSNESEPNFRIPKFSRNKKPTKTKSVSSDESTGSENSLNTKAYIKVVPDIPKQTENCDCAQLTKQIHISIIYIRSTDHYSTDIGTEDEHKANYIDLPENKLDPLSNATESKLFDKKDNKQKSTFDTIGENTRGASISSKFSRKVMKDSIDVANSKKSSYLSEALQSKASQNVDILAPIRSNKSDNNITTKPLSSQVDETTYIEKSDGTQSTVTFPSQKRDTIAQTADIETSNEDQSNQTFTSPKEDILSQTAENLNEHQSMQTFASPKSDILTQTTDDGKSNANQSIQSFVSRKESDESQSIQTLAWEEISHVASIEFSEQGQDQNQKVDPLRHTKKGTVRNPTHKKSAKHAVKGKTNDKIISKKKSPHRNKFAEDTVTVPTPQSIDVLAPTKEIIKFEDTMSKLNLSTDTTINESIATHPIDKPEKLFDTKSTASQKQKKHTPTKKKPNVIPPKIINKTQAQKSTPENETIKKIPTKALHEKDNSNKLNTKTKPLKLVQEDVVSVSIEPTDKPNIEVTSASNIEIGSQSTIETSIVVPLIQLKYNSNNSTMTYSQKEKDEEKVKQIAKKEKEREKVRGKRLSVSSNKSDGKGSRRRSKRRSTSSSLYSSPVTTSKDYLCPTCATVDQPSCQCIKPANTSKINFKDLSRTTICEECSSKHNDYTVPAPIRQEYLPEIYPIKSIGQPQPICTCCNCDTQQLQSHLECCCSLDTVFQNAGVVDNEGNSDMCIINNLISNMQRISEGSTDVGCSCGCRQNCAPMQPYHNHTQPYAQLPNTYVSCPFLVPTQNTYYPYTCNEIRQPSTNYCATDNTAPKQYMYEIRKIILKRD